MQISRYSHLWVFQVLPGGNVNHSDLYLQTGPFDCPEKSFGLRIANQTSGHESVQGLLEFSCTKGIIRVQCMPVQLCIMLCHRMFGLWSWGAIWHRAIRWNWQGSLLPTGNTRFAMHRAIYFWHCHVRWTRLLLWPYKVLYSIIIWFARCLGTGKFANTGSCSPRDDNGGE